ncbi:MAG: recombinase RecA [Methanobrevibacter sp.]|nr:recombinase RecA [Methanobrevibacter sp.]
MSNLEKALSEINKRFGKNSVIVLGDQNPNKVNCISTGSLQLDKALGGGIAKGRITEIYGVEGAGKTSLCLQVVSQSQFANDAVAYVDVENAVDLNYAKTLGVNVSTLIFSQPSSAEQALDIVEALVKSNEVGLIIIDSVAALAPQAELDGEMGDATIGLTARLMGKALRKITAAVNQTNCAVVFINQLRSNIGGYGNPDTTPGGRALKYAASQRIEMRKTTAIKEGPDVVGNMVKIKVTKNKIAPPMQVVELPLIFGKGFSPENEVIDLAIDFDIIQKSGAWFNTHDGTRLQGKAAVKSYYEANPNLMEALTKMVKDRLAGEEIKQDYEIDPDTGEVILE